MNTNLYSCCHFASQRLKPNRRILEIFKENSLLKRAQCASSAHFCETSSSDWAQFPRKTQKCTHNYINTFICIPIYTNVDIYTYIYTLAHSIPSNDICINTHRDKTDVRPRRPAWHCTYALVVRALCMLRLRWVFSGVHTHALLHSPMHTLTQAQCVVLLLLSVNDARAYSR